MKHRIFGINTALVLVSALLLWAGLLISAITCVVLLCIWSVSEGVFKKVGGLQICHHNL